MTEEQKTENIVVEMPEKFKAKYLKKKEEMNLKNGRFFQISLNVTKAQRKLMDIQKEMESTNASMQDDVNQSVKRLKLEKRKDYRWKFNGRDGSFIGIPVKQQPKKEEKK